MNQFQDLTDFLDKYDIKYTVKSDCVEVNGDVDMHDELLSELPESFGFLRINGSLYLDGNALKFLPESFGNLKVTEILDLSNNSLQSLPESFGDIEVGGDLFIDCNELEPIKTSFANLKVGGEIWEDDQIEDCTSEWSKKFTEIGDEMDSALSHLIDCMQKLQEHIKTV
jgi:hypothetical protein